MSVRLGAVLLAIGLLWGAVASETALASVVASRTTTLEASGQRIRLQALRTVRANGLAQHSLRLQVLRGGRYRFVDVEQVTSATAQPSGRDFCGLRIVSVSRTRVRVAYCAKPSASIGRVTSFFTASGSGLSPA